MRQALRSAMVPAYILLCILLGGSTQGIWRNAVLQLLAIPIIVWALLTRDRLRLSAPAKALFAIATITILIIIMQLIPLPAPTWTMVPGRTLIVEGYQLLGQSLPWQPISLTPYDTAATGLTLLPPLAVLIGMLVAGAHQPSWIVIAVLFGTFAAVLLGALQVASPDHLHSGWYLYKNSSYGWATGFFANSNHMATLLVISVPLLVALIAAVRTKAHNSKPGSTVLLALSGIPVLLVGIFLNGSLATLVLGLPVTVISLTMLWPPGPRFRGFAITLALLSIGAILITFVTPLRDKLWSVHAFSFQSRQEIWSNMVPAIRDNMPVGSGVGSFRQAYLPYEDAAAVTRTFVNHAHNDYLEIALETGLPGLVVLAAFFLWWGRRTAAVWRPEGADKYAVAASVASAAVLAHSLVDYPLRTAALSTTFAACLALMAEPRAMQGNGNADLWPTTRHLEI